MNSNAIYLSTLCSVETIITWRHKHISS